MNAEDAKAIGELLFAIVTAEAKAGIALDGDVEVCDDGGVIAVVRFDQAGEPLIVAIGGKEADA